MTEETQTCPRRMADLGPWEYKHNLDTWQLVGNDRCCSFCGSMHPEDFERICDQAITDENTWLEQSDKSYKVYIHRAGIGNASEGAIEYYKQHNYTEPADIERMTEKFRQAMKASIGKSRKYYGF